MSDPGELRASTLDVIVALQQQRSTDFATARLRHTTLLIANTLERWWLPLLDDLVEDDPTPC